MQNMMGYLTSSPCAGSPAQVEQSGSLLMQSLRSLVEMIAAGARPMLAETKWKWDLLEQLQQAEDGMAALLRGLDSLKAAQGGRCVSRLSSSSIEH